MITYLLLESKNSLFNVYLWWQASLKTSIWMFSLVPWCIVNRAWGEGMKGKVSENVSCESKLRRDVKPWVSAGLGAATAELWQEVERTVTRGAITVRSAVQIITIIILMMVVMMIDYNYYLLIIIIIIIIIIILLTIQHSSYLFIYLLIDTWHC